MSRRRPGRGERIIVRRRDAVKGDCCRSLRVTDWSPIVRGRIAQWGRRREQSTTIAP
jgi:hypothetical protein